MRKRLSWRLLINISLLASLASCEIKYLEIDNYGTATATLQTTINDAIIAGHKENKYGRELCEYIVKKMENDGKSWNCIKNVGTFWINADDGNDTAASLLFDGASWLIFKGEQIIKDADFQDLKTSLASLQTAKDDVDAQLKVAEAAKTKLTADLKASNTAKGVAEKDATDAKKQLANANKLLDTEKKNHADYITKNSQSKLALALNDMSAEKEAVSTQLTEANKAKEECLKTKEDIGKLLATKTPQTPGTTKIPRTTKTPRIPRTTKSKQD